MIPGDLLSAFPHRQFHTLPGLLDSWATLPNSNPNACVPMQGGSLHHFYDGLWYDPAERRTHDLPCERRTRYRLSQPDTVRESFTGVKVLAQFLPGTEWTQQGVRPDPTGLPVFLSIANTCQISGEFEANFEGKLLDWAVLDHIETNYNSFKRSYIILR